MMVSLVRDVHMIKFSLLGSFEMKLIGIEE